MWTTTTQQIRLAAEYRERDLAGSARNAAPVRDRSGHTPTFSSVRAILVRAGHALVLRRSRAKGHA